MPGDPHVGASSSGAWGSPEDCSQWEKSPLASWEEDRPVTTLETPRASMLPASHGHWPRDALPKGVAVYTHRFTFLQDQIPLEIFTINLFSS